MGIQLLLKHIHTCMAPKMISLQSNNLAVIDIETSGINPFRHEVLSVALVPLTLSATPCVVYVRAHEIQWSLFAKKNFENFSPDWNANAVPAAAAYDEIEQYITQTFEESQVTVIGHNVGFDVAFMRKLAFNAGKDELPRISHRALDTHTMLYLLFLKGQLPSSALSSDGAFDFFGINISDRDRHTSLGDALATRELVLRLFEMLQVPI